MHIRDKVISFCFLVFSSVGMCPVLCNFRQVSGSWEPKGVHITGHLGNRCNGGGVRTGGAEEKSGNTLLLCR